jgi:hypothetical protein
MPSVHPLQFEILRDRRAYGRAIVDARRIQHAGAAQEPRVGANLRVLRPAPRTSGAALPFGRGIEAGRDIYFECYCDKQD